MQERQGRAPRAAAAYAHAAWLPGLAEEPSEQDVVEPLNLGDIEDSMADLALAPAVPVVMEASEEYVYDDQSGMQDGSEEPESDGGDDGRHYSEAD